MKTLKFKPHLVDLILEGTKTETWRLFDDKDLQVGDSVEFKNSETGEAFAKAEITEVEEKTLGTLTDADFEGHERYKDDEDMLRHYRSYYGDSVTLETPLKIVKFKLL